MTSLVYLVVVRRATLAVRPNELHNAGDAGAPHAPAQMDRCGEMMRLQVLLLLVLLLLGVPEAVERLRQQRGKVLVLFVHLVRVRAGLGSGLGSGSSFLTLVRGHPPYPRP